MLPLPLVVARSLLRSSLLLGRPSGPALFVALLSVVFLAFPCLYLYMALRERGVFRRYLGR